MVEQIVFIIITLAAFGFLCYSFMRIFSFMKLTRPHKTGRWGTRIVETVKTAFLQDKIFRRPFTGFLHALVFWGFCIILFGSLEMLIDGVAGTEHSLSFLGLFYRVLMLTGDIFAYIILVAVFIFIVRRVFLKVKRFTGAEMTHKTHIDANIALSLIFLLMLTLAGMNISSCIINNEAVSELYPVSNFFAGMFGNTGSGAHICYKSNWWSHIILIFVFMNILPYSKHFHVFMSVPNVLLSRLEPLGKLRNMDNVTKEVKLMLGMAGTEAEAGSSGEGILRFGVKDVEDVTWKNYLDSLSCTQCGRCTASCPANITGKKLSPRKIMIDLRARMKEKAPLLIKNGKDYSDGKALLNDYITAEEIWACTTCNACAKECPVNINHPEMIIELRRYLVMEEASSPPGLNTMFTNIENNGAPWQFSPEDRMLWAKDIITTN